jgi:TolB-like protein/rhodanese-related sulfurtransferase
MPSIVVLPFENLRADTKQAYFADGITEDLIADLSKLSGIFVIAKNTAWSYRQRPIDVEKAARDLGVRYVLDGSVRRDGARLRINAELLDMVADRLLWADRFDGTIEDVFALQDKVIAQIVSALAVRLTGAESARAEAETENPQAYDAFSQGRDFLRRDTEADTLRAIALFEKAVALDPGYSRAYAALAAAQWRVTLSFWFSASGAGWQRAYDGLVGSLAKAKTKPTALAYAVSAQLLSQQGRYPEALAEVERALALAPSEPDGHLARAAVLNATGRAAEAEEEVRLAMRSDPYSAPATLRLLAISLFNQERYDEAARTLERIIALTPDAAVDYSTLISALGHLGRLDRVPALIEEYNALAVPAAHDPLTVQESAWDWYGVAFDYHRPYLLRMQAGLRKAGVPEGAGTDLSLDDYAGLVVRRLGEFEVKGIPRIDATEARSLRGRGVSFVDVRAHLDFRKGHIPGAVNLSLVVDLSREALARAFPDRDAEIAFYCHGKYCPYAAYGAAKAVVWGYRRVYYFAGGFPAWQDAGAPVEVSSGL